MSGQAVQRQIAALRGQQRLANAQQDKASRAGDVDAALEYQALAQRLGQQIVQLSNAAAQAGKGAR